LNIEYLGFGIIVRLDSSLEAISPEFSHTFPFFLFSMLRSGYFRCARSCAKVLLFNLTDFNSLNMNLRFCSLFFSILGVLGLIVSIALMSLLPFVLSFLRSEPLQWHAEIVYAYDICIVVVILSILSLISGFTLQKGGRIGVIMGLFTGTLTILDGLLGAFVQVSFWSFPFGPLLFLIPIGVLMLIFMLPVIIRRPKFLPSRHLDRVRVAVIEDNIRRKEKLRKFGTKYSTVIQPAGSLEEIIMRLGMLEEN
jgi:hypothetical protein